MPDVITLPKGGGAIQGIGEKFSPDLYTGTGNLTVPIAVPPGRNGFQPQLSLVYSTGNGNGPFGLGWNLSIPGVSRKTSKGVPRYRDYDPKGQPDVFILSGAEDLVPVETPMPGVTRYRPRTEGLFARIQHHHSKEDNDDYWEVCSTNGLLSRYGTKGKAGEDPATLADLTPIKDRHVFAWKLTQTSDPFGNLIRYDYGERDRGNENGRLWDQPLLSRIRYVDYDNPPKFLISVSFSYEERADAFSDYRAGFEIRLSKRCHTITVKTHADQDRTVRQYRFEYEYDTWNGISLLKRLHVIGYDDDGNSFDVQDDDTSRYQRQLPPLEFGYTRFEPNGRKFQAITGAGLPTHSLGSPDLELVDLHGNGLPDILETNGVVRYWRNLGGGRFDLPRPMHEAPPHALGDPGVQLIDANGDGRMDLMVTNGTLAGYYPLTYQAAWSRRSFQTYKSPPSFDLRDPDVRLIDLNGDGVTDAIRSGTSMECLYNDPHTGWSNIVPVYRKSLDDFPNVSFSDPCVKLGDMTGDNMQDIVIVYDGNVEYWPNFGYGQWGKRIHMRNSPRFKNFGYAAGYDSKRILLGDVDGDGLSDIVYVGDQHVTIWINQSGNRWSDPVVIHGTPPVMDVDAVRLVDLLGTGVSGVLWSAGANYSGRPSIYFLDLTGGIKPYVMIEMDNNMGAATRVKYAPSTRFYLDDAKKPATRWLTPLPFPVQVVERVEVIDAISRGKLTTCYRYHHGYWDGAEREFRGFGMVEQIDSETSDEYGQNGLHGDSVFSPVTGPRFSTPTLTRTWFHQGPVGEEFGEWQEMDRSHEYWQGDPELLDHTGRVNRFLARYVQSPKSRRIKRDALRALRGSVLRSELYALDRFENQDRIDPSIDRPYTVSEVAYDVTEISPPPAGSEHRQHIFFPHVVLERTTQWERGDDPMTRFSIKHYQDEAGDFDPFGRLLRHTALAIPRRPAKRAVFSGTGGMSVGADETRLLATHTWTNYATPATGLYIHNRIAQVKTYQLAKSSGVTESNPVDVRVLLRAQWAEALAAHEQLCQGHHDGLIGHVINHYDGDAYEGKAIREVGPYGALARSEALVLTRQLLDAAYAGDPAKPDRCPEYLGGTSTLPGGAPAGFGTSTGYHLKSAGDTYEAGYYVDTKRVKFDFQDASPMPARGVVVATQDTLGHETRMALDSYGLLPVKVIDAAQLETSVAYNYRTLQPSVVTDPNGNKTHFRYSPVGLVNKIWLQSNANQGGAEDKPELEYAYDFLNYARSRGTDTPQPVYARTTARLYHARVSDPGVPHSDETIESREYSDGFGRLIQKRTQAEDLCFGATGDDVGLLIDGKAEPGKARAEANATATTGSVIVSGWQTYDNKGRVVEKYEPFFDQGWQFLPDAKRGRHVTIFYDSRGQMIRIINPNGAEERIIFGVPGKVGAPNVNRVDDFEPTPWEIYTYDANDLAQETFHPDVGSLSGMPSPLTDVARDATHYCTPASVLLDGLGRVICRAQRNGHDPSTDWHLTRSAYDLRGNLLEVTDPLNRRAFTHIYDLLSRLLRVDSIDAGLHTSVLDAEGNLIEYRDSKGSIVLRQYDELNRPVGVWAINDAAAVQTLTRREKIIYGEKSGLPDPGERNLLDKAYVHYDEAGKLTFERYDFKGNLVEKVRRVVSDAAIAAAGGWTADWTGDPVDESPLEAQDYQTNTVFDALDRPISITYPKDARGNRAHLAPLYNRSGALQSVKLDGVAYVDSITYNAKGQRVIIAYGNHIMTRYAYDAQSFRLVRLRSEKFSMPDNHTWKSAPESDAYSWLFQDFTYEYDLVGNITSIMDRTPGGGLPSTPGALDRVFGYDPIYRLTHATGRACPAPPPKPIWDDTVRCHDVTQATAYQQWYRYDAADNMAELRHQSANTANGYTKHLSLAANQNGDGSNRLGSVTLGAGIYRYVYDENGNMIQENTDRHFTWDQADRMIEFRSQATPISIPSIEVRHFYGADGVRVKKWVRTSGTGTGESTTYIDGIFEHQRWHKSGQPGQTSYLHVLDNQNCVALVRVGDVHPDDRGPAVQYLLGDHLGSSNVVTGGDDVQGNTFINREEYFPFGETSFGSYDRKRYRFTGKERDEGTGLYYHGGRHYAPWLGRWISCDPGGTKDGLNRYGYVRNDPVRMFDEDGRDAAAFLVRTGAAVRTGTFAAGAGGVAAESALSGALGIAGLGLMVIMYAQSLIDETEAAMDSADEAFRRSIEMEKRFHAELAKAVKEGRLRNEDAVAIMRGQKDISDVEYKAPAALPAPTTQSDAAPEAEPQPAAGSSGKGIRCHATPGGTNPPPFDMGDVKSLASYRSGLRHLAEMTARYGGVLRTALALYDNLTGDVYLQVFEPDDQGVRRVVWEGIIGKCEIPEGLGPAPLGNNIEAPIRNLVESAMKQKFADKAPNAPGPDLVPVKP